MIKLYQYTPAFGLPNVSPFCMKVENYLRMTGLPYQTVNGLNLARAPKGKLPFIEDKGQLIADSGLIIDYLKHTYGDPLDAHLSSSERSTALAFIRLLDEHLYWAANVYPRWIENANWTLTRDAFFKDLPAHLRFIVPIVARHNIKKQFYGHGMGRHQNAEIYALACADIAAVADFLGNKTFFLGDKPTTLDAAAYAYLTNIMWIPIESPAKRYAMQLENLQAYCHRMKERYYADWP